MKTTQQFPRDARVWIQAEGEPLLRDYLFACAISPVWERNQAEGALKVAFMNMDKWIHLKNPEAPYPFTFNIGNYAASLKPRTGDEGTHTPELVQLFNYLDARKQFFEAMFRTEDHIAEAWQYQQIRAGELAIDTLLILRHAEAQRGAFIQPREPRGNRPFDAAFKPVPYLLHYTTDHYTITLSPFPHARKLTTGNKDWEQS